MSEIEEFSRDLLNRISASLGLTYEQLTADYYDTQRAEILDRYRRWQRWEAERQAFFEIKMRGMMTMLMLEVMIGWSVEQICGYNPQRLLEYRP